ncbi:MAG: polyphosphate polymerase domain-containing protein [Bacteroidales bacterium]|nr:polyphosphate polymerase domain-containing protein [Bacteroidales bacterium]MCF8389150.1 polyphosphate polymerase domain-containing protein [Bacteroidales bacterium]
MSSQKNVEEILSGFKAISLDDVQKASLLRRKDSKFIFSVEKLPVILKELQSDYDVLEIDKKRYQNYHTTYYDTSKLEMYNMHHDGRVNRHKIRFRKYDSTDIVFLEVKKKDPKGVTTKKRLKIENGNTIILSKEEEFLSSCTPYRNRNMYPVLENTFNRITLVHRGQEERITLDYQLNFSKTQGDVIVDLPGVAIGEIKYQNRLSASVFVGVLKRNKISPRRFSKYCTGMAMLNPELKQNLFKQRIRRVNKLNKLYLENINK